eukprot:scaffold1123_cov347-Prasinococcus_capsulatus_cf.AAC.2
MMMYAYTLHVFIIMKIIFIFMMKMLARVCRTPGVDTATVLYIRAHGDLHPLPRSLATPGRPTAGRACA